MKKKNLFRSFLCLLLSAVMLAALLAVPAFSEDAEAPEYKQCPSMLTLGTSMIRSHEFGDYNIYDDRTVHGFYGNTPYYVGEAVGANFEDTYLAAIAGETVSMPLWLLGLLDETDDYLYNVNTHHREVRYWQRLYPFYGKDIGAEGAYSFSEIIRTTDLIVIELGLGDTVFRAKELALPILEDGSVLEAVEVLIEQLFEGFEYFQSRFPMLLDYIKENNPEAEVVLVGCTNPANDIILTDESFIPVGDALNIIFDALNAYIKQEAKAYGFKFADVFGMETNAMAELKSVTDEEFLSRLDFYLHPSVEGMKFMARKILEQLEVEPQTNRIRIDLGPVQSVKSVFVDAKAVTDYSLNAETHTLTLPHRLNRAKSVMVTSTGEDGKTYMAVYVISRDTDGYTAQKLYSTVDVGKMFSNLVTTLTTALQTIESTIKSVFVKV